MNTTLYPKGPSLNKAIIDRIVYVKQGQVVTDSAIIADHLKVKHWRVSRAVESVIDDYPHKTVGLRVTICDPKLLGFSASCWTVTKEYRGQKYDVYVMDKAMVSLVSMRFTTKQARQWQLRYCVFWSIAITQ
ncbi:Rha family transcriptional regulator [Dongshaea marina]|uniref:Rha family transcriptional regulator n=1 Tax=Dongshaea marina TaxID=2047966 RepID=UPI000D3E1A54|nr:Rha family transcriptional regulator [Dongshaea marina]